MNRSAEVPARLAVGEGGDIRPTDAVPGEAAEPNRVLRWIAARRRWLFALVLLFFILSFNGYWRAGRDSALYRAVGNSLAHGEGYTFRGQHQTHVYPGLPYLLAGMQRLFGDDIERPVPQLVVMWLAAGAALVVTYQLLKLHFPRWLAVFVTVVMGVHWRFLMQANEIMTDGPFVLAVMVALWGHTKLQQARTGREYASAIALAALGLAGAASLRPTFWALAGAWVLADAWGLSRAETRRTCLWSLGTLLALVLIWLVADPRTDSFRPLEGMYEKQAVSRLEGLDAATLWGQVVQAFEEHIPEAVFGVQPFPSAKSIARWFGVPKEQVPVMPGLNSLVSILILVRGLTLFRMVPLWGLLVVLTVGMTLLVGSVPRYYLMIMPLLILGCVLGFDELQQRQQRKPDRRWWPELAMGVAAALFFLPNVVRAGGFVLEQRGITSDGLRPFARIYRDGEMRLTMQMARTIRQKLSKDTVVIGHEPRILSYVSGRRVFGLDEIMNPNRDAVMALKARELGAKYAIFPAKMYERDAITYKLMSNGYIQPHGPVRGQVGRMWLQAIQIKRTPGRPATRPVDHRLIVPPKKKKWKKKSSASRPAMVAPVTQPTTAPLPKRPAPERGRS